jgi:hypothetical protein
MVVKCFIRLGLGPNVIKLLQPFLPSLVFVGKVEAYLSEVSFWSTTVG